MADVIYYDLAIASLDDIRRRTREAIDAGRSPMSVPFLRVVETTKFVPLMEKFTRTLFGDLR
jgi:hypothetical protein